MRIIFLTRSWHGTGGMQRFSRDFAECLTEEYGGDAVIVHPTSRGLLSKAAFVLRAFVAGIRLKKGAQVHLGDASLLPLGSVIKRWTGASLSVTVHGLDVLYPNALYQWMIRRLLPKTDRVCAVSEATAESARARGAAADRIIVIPCGIHVSDDESIRSASERGPMLITVGRLIPRKGVAWFIDSVLPLLLHDFPHLQYHVVGDGPESGAIQRTIERHALQQHVFLHRSCGDDERDALLLQSDLFVMPNVAVENDMEGFGIVCIEAARLGVPISAAKLQGIRDAVIEGRTGRFFTPGDADDCMHVISDMLRYPLPANDVRRSTEQRFGWPLVFARYVHDIFS